MSFINRVISYGIKKTVPGAIMNDGYSSAGPCCYSKSEAQSRSMPHCDTANNTKYYQETEKSYGK